MPSAGDKELKRLHYKTQQYEVAFHKYVEEMKEKAFEKSKGIILCGDFNVAH